MKIAVIIGVAHMTLGLLQKGLNALYFKKRLDFVHEFVPQILMLFCMFGYMDILIIKKWLTNYQGYESEVQSIITTMVSMFLE
jgi:V-type H+-transporting ATPase subunit a